MAMPIIRATNPTPRRHVAGNTADRPARLDQANAVLGIIADNGPIFRSGGQRSYFSMLHDRLVFFHDSFGGTIEIYRINTNTWSNFSEAGLMKTLVRDLREYILMGTKIPARHFGPWPQWFSHGDPWGYGPAAMARVRAAVAELGVLA